jgi:hypothetical protein
MNSTSVVLKVARNASTVAAAALLGGTALASECASLAIPAGEVIWCDSFENEDLPPSGNFADNYFDFNDATGGQRFGRSSAEAHEGTYSLRQGWLAGEVSPGWIYRTFGRNPLSSQSHSQTDFREIYWRFFVKYPTGTASFPNKVSRTIIYSDTNWAQALIGHLWLVDHGSRFLRIDPASGTDTAGNLRSTFYNDFANMRWLGAVDSPIPIAVGAWQCHEAHIKLNAAGASDGVFELWLDDTLAAARYNMNWVGAYNAYGINSVMLESYWNGGAPQATERYIDNFVIATGRIGCSTMVAVRPMPPTQLVAQ